MKKHLAMLVVAVIALSVLGTAEFAAAPIGGAAKQNYLQDFTPTQKFLNPTPTNIPGPGVSIQVKIQVLPPMILRKSNQVIYVTILYDKKGFDPLEWATETFHFGATGTDALPIAFSISDVNHDGYKDLTLAFNAKDTGFTSAGLSSAKLTGTVTTPGGCRRTLCINPINILNSETKQLTKQSDTTLRACIDPIICQRYSVSVTGTVTVLVL